MYLDSMENIGITTDPHKVRPGMIYVDLSQRRNKRQIYEAYDNGAYLIFTPYNISDPELPVIKAHNPQDTLLKMLNKLYGNQERRSKLVAVFGGSNKSVMLELIKSILKDRSSNKETFINGSSRIRSNMLYHGGGAEELFSVFMGINNDSEAVIPVGIDADIGNMFPIGSMDIDCAILTDGGYGRDIKGAAASPDYLAAMLEKKLIIVNNDDEIAVKAAEVCKNAVHITYGLNKKAAVTASSIDLGEDTCFNYCVQSSFETKSGNVVEPFEIPVRLSAMGCNNIYNALAAITCGLYYDADIEYIKEVVEGYKSPARYFQKVYEGEYSIIDNYCSTLYDYNAAFESLQILSYDNLMLIVSVSQSEHYSHNMEKAQMIADWVKLLKCREVVFTSCMDGDLHIGELPLKNMRIYKKVFKENHVPFKYYHLLQHAIERCLSQLSRRDLLVMLGGIEMNMAQRLLHKQLRLPAGSLIKH